MTNGDKLLNIKEAAAYLGVHWQTVRNYIKDGRLKSYKIGQNVRIKKTDLSNFIENKSEGLEITKYEQRFSINNVNKLEVSLIKQNAVLEFYGHLTDHWYMPNKIKDVESKDLWFGSGTGYGTRIREVKKTYNYKPVTTLSVNRVVFPYDYDISLEAETEISSYEMFDKILSLSNMQEFLTLEKERKIYSIKGFEFVIDHVDSLGTELEIRKSATASEDEIKSQLSALVIELKIGNYIKSSEVSLSNIAMERFGVFK